MAKGTSASVPGMGRGADGPPEINPTVLVPVTDDTGAAPPGQMKNSRGPGIVGDRQRRKQRVPTIVPSFRLSAGDLGSGLAACLALKGAFLIIRRRGFKLDLCKPHRHAACDAYWVRKFDVKRFEPAHKRSTAVTGGSAISHSATDAWRSRCRWCNDHAPNIFKSPWGGSQSEPR